MRSLVISLVLVFPKVVTSFSVTGLEAVQLSLKRWNAPRNKLTCKATAAPEIQRLQKELYKVNASSKVEVLSEDPLIYIVHDLLSAEECDAYCKKTQNRSMTKSNPPEVSLDPAKLWPFPLLSIGAGLPPYIRLLQDRDTTGTDISYRQLATTVLPNIAIALAAMVTLAWLVVLPLVRKISASESRTSVATALNQDDDVEFIRPLVRRASVAALDHPWMHWEAPVVTRYDTGAIFARHGDASPTYGSEWQEEGGQRVVTCICYLNTLDATGGETYFDKIDLKVAPTAGSGLFFFPADKDSLKADERTTHESLSPSADKWIVQLFGRIGRVPPPLGLPTSFDL